MQERVQELSLYESGVVKILCPGDRARSDMGFLAPGNVVFTCVQVVAAAPLLLRQVYNSDSRKLFRTFGYWT